VQTIDLHGVVILSVEMGSFRDVGIVGLLHHLIQHRFACYDVAVRDALCEIIDRELLRQIDEHVELLLIVSVCIRGGRSK
jgi:hypothetical protein